MRSHYREALKRAGHLAQAADHHGALAAYDEATRLAPCRADAHYEMGLLHHKLGRVAEAITCFERAAELAPEDATIWNNLGVLYYGCNELAQAERAFRQALSLDGRYGDAWYDLGRTLEKLGREQEAAQALRNCLLWEPHKGKAEQALVALEREPAPAPAGQDLVAVRRAGSRGRSGVAQKTMIFGHRGDMETYSSNTKESVLSALNRCDGLELDLNVSKDGVFYFYHEGDWTTPVIARRYMFAELDRFVPTGESVLSLQEALQFVKQMDKCLLIHAEIGGVGHPWARDFSKRELQDVLSIIGESGVDRRLVLFHTGNPAKAMMLRVDGHTVFHRNIPRRRHGMYRFADLVRLLPHIDVSATMAYVINDESEFQSLTDHGVGYILTDRLLLMRLWHGEAQEQQSTTCTGLDAQVRNRIHLVGHNQPEYGDDRTYYCRVGPRVQTKKRAIRDFVLARDDIRFILDVGCNNGDMSHQFIQHGIDVLGMDISSDLQIPEGYDFVQCDITKSQTIIINDCTLFLSLYHHIFCGDGLDAADDLFYKLLLRTNYLVFDCGNVRERGIYRQGWIRSLKRYFSSERELLDHFAVRYTPIGAWNTAGASRTIVVFERGSFDQGVEIVDEFRRGIGSAVQGRGLTSIEAIDDWQEFYEWTIFHKLRLGKKLFFAKKHLQAGHQEAELDNIIEVYDNFPREELLEFYGVSKRFGLIYEWIDDFRYRGKARAATVHGVHLCDADVIEVDGQLKFIDFESWL